MGPTWVLSAPDWPHVRPMNFAIGEAVYIVPCIHDFKYCCPLLMNMPVVVLHVCLPQAFLGLTHWGRVTHICVSKLTIIGSDNGLSLGRHKAIIWTNAAVLLIRTLGTNFGEIVIEIHTFSLKKMHLKMSSAKRQPFCLGLNVLTPVVGWL